MGQSKDGGYQKLTTATSNQSRGIEAFIKMAAPFLQQSGEAYRQFLPGAGGGKAIADEANANFNQYTLPSIMNAFGSGAKSSSALNQALAAGASNLNTSLASQQSQNALQAAGGIGSLGGAAGQLGSQNQFAYAPRQQPFWQSAVLSGIGAGGQALAAKLGA